MRTPWIAPAVVALVGMAAWGIVETTSGGRDAPPALTPTSVPTLALADEMALERAAYRARLADKARDARRARAAAEARRIAAERAAEPAPPPETDGWVCYPAGCVPPVDPNLPAAPENAGEPPGPYCYASPTGRVCTTY